MIFLIRAEHKISQLSRTDLQIIYCITYYDMISSIFSISCQIHIWLRMVFLRFDLGRIASDSWKGNREFSSNQSIQNWIIGLVPILRRGINYLIPTKNRLSFARVTILHAALRIRYAYIKGTQDDLERM